MLTMMKLLMCVSISCTMLLHCTQSKKLIKADRVDICEDQPINGSISIQISIEYNRTVGTIFNADISIGRDYRSIKLQLVFTKCASREALDTCESFALNPINTCAFLKMKGTPWSPFWENIHPEFKCPVKKGTYRLTNGTIDPNFFAYNQMQTYYWKLKYMFYAGKTLELSICSEFRIVNAAPK